MFSTYMKKEFYYNASSRLVAGIDIELIFHYILYSKEINKTFRILYNATNKYLAKNLTNRGYAGVFNIYCKQFLELASKAIPNIIFRLTTKNLAKLVVSSFGSSLLLSVM